MDESQIKELLEKIPGSRRAANGIIFPGEDGDSFYAVNLLKKEEMEGLTDEETFFIGFCLEVSQQLSEVFIKDVKRGVSDILTFYGSIYLPSYTKRSVKTE